MATTLEKRVAALEQSVGEAALPVLVLFDESPVPQGFDGHVVRVALVKPQKAVQSVSTDRVPQPSAG